MWTTSVRHYDVVWKGMEKVKIGRDFEVFLASASKPISWKPSNQIFGQFPHRTWTSGNWELKCWRCYWCERLSRKMVRKFDSGKLKRGKHTEREVVKTKCSYRNELGSQPHLRRTRSEPDTYKGISCRIRNPKKLLDFVSALNENVFNCKNKFWLEVSKCIFRFKKLPEREQKRPKYSDSKNFGQNCEFSRKQTKM